MKWPWVRRRFLETSHAANKALGEERDKYRNRQDGYNVLCHLMDHAGIVGVEEVISGDGSKSFILCWADGHTEYVGLEVNRIWERVKK